MRLRQGAQVLSDDRICVSMREAGLRKAEQYSWPCVVTQLLDYFHEVMSLQ